MSCTYTKIAKGFISPDCVYCRVIFRDCAWLFYYYYYTIFERFKKNLHWTLQELSPFISFFLALSSDLNKEWRNRKHVVLRRGQDGGVIYSSRQHKHERFLQYIYDRFWNSLPETNFRKLADSWWKKLPSYFVAVNYKHNHKLPEVVCTVGAQLSIPFAELDRRHFKCTQMCSVMMFCPPLHPICGGHISVTHWTAHVINSFIIHLDCFHCILPSRPSLSLGFILIVQPPEHRQKVAFFINQSVTERFPSPSHKYEIPNPMIYPCLRARLGKIQSCSSDRFSPH